MPLALAGVALAGYMYAADELAAKSLETLWLATGVTVVYGMVSRWVLISRRSLSFRQRRERIAPSILQVLIRLLHDGAAPLDAVTAPRLFCSLSGRVSLEASRMRDDLSQALEKRGFTVDLREPFSFYLGCVQLVVRDRKELIGVADPRRDGAAGGPKRPAAPATKA